LVLGRLPRSFVKPLSDYIVFITRVYSYNYLMNDAYPPFSADKDFAVNVEIPTTNVPRLAVLFRIVLLVPATIVSTIAGSGVIITVVFIWLIVLVKGEMPLSLFGALAAVLRYQARFYAYYMMLTSKYPGELFGDQPSAPSEPSWASAGAPSVIPPLSAAPAPFRMGAPGLAESPGEPATPNVVSSNGPTEVATPPRSAAPAPFRMGAPGMAEPPREPEMPNVESESPHEEVAVTPGAPVGAPLTFAPSDSPVVGGEAPRTARLVLSRGSKNILVIFLVLGALGQVAERALDNRILNNQSALTKVIDANNLLNSEVFAAKSQKTNCSLAADVCIHQYFAIAAVDFSNFEATMASTSFPSGVQADARQLETTTTKFVAVLDELKIGVATQSELTRLQTLGTAFDTEFQQVLNDLSSPI
jgi:hypothetical protein